MRIVIKMKLIILIIFLVLFFNCTKTTVINQNKDIDISNNNSHSEYETVEIEIMNEVNLDMEFINENYYTLEEIKKYIFNYLNLDNSFSRYVVKFNTLDEIISTLNIPEKYSVTESIVHFEPHDGVFTTYSIEWNSHKIVFIKYDDSDYYFYESMQIILNHDNYLNLFPL